MALLEPQLGFIFWHTVIFLVTLTLLSRYAWKPILHAIKSREEAYAQAAHEMKQAQKEVVQLKKKQKEILEEAYTQSDRILQEALESKEVILEKAEKEALQKRQQIIERALQAIELERQAAASELKERAVELVLHTTEKLIVQKLAKDPAQHEAIQAMIEEVEKRNNISYSSN